MDTKVNIVWLRLLRRLKLLEPTCLCSATIKNDNLRGAQLHNNKNLTKCTGVRRILKETLMPTCHYVQHI